MLWNVNECGKNKCNENFKTTIASKNYHRPKTTGECGIFKYFVSILTNDGRCACEMKCGIAMAKAAFNKKRTLFTSTLDLELRKKLVNCYVWNIALYGAETLTLRAVDQKHLESFEIWCWRRMEKTSWTDHVRNEDILLRVKEQRNILHEIRKRKANWIGHILRRNCLLQRVTESKIQGGIEVTGRRRRRRRKLLDDLNYLNTQLNPICYLLALLGAHPIFYVSGVRVKERR
jgi:hypothetical protein